MSLFIENILLNDSTTNILIENNLIAGIGEHIPMPANAIRIEGQGKAALPSFANMHTHAAMSLLRGCGNDCPLDVWLNQHIWPREQRLTDEAVYWGVRLACLEMIKSGTTLLNDMYFHIPAAARAIHDAGIRGVLGINYFGDAKELTDDSLAQLQESVAPYHERVCLALAPHSIYTVSPAGLRHCAEMSHKHGLLYHIHMSETEKEVQECLDTHHCRPYELLEQLGVLELTEGRFVGAHSLHLSPDEIALMGSRKVTAVHNPCSNLKLGSGNRFFYTELRDAGCTVTLGTDGCASSNNLDMVEAAKFMSYLQKGTREDPTVLPADELLEVATANGYNALGIHGGKIEVEMLADLMLIDLDNIAFTPYSQLVPGLFYAAHGDAVDTVICNGRLLMQHRHVESEEEIIRHARQAAKQLTSN